MISGDCWGGRQRTGKNWSSAQSITGVICARAVLCVSHSCYRNPKLKKEGLSCSSHLGDLAGKLPLSLSIFLLKLADFSNLLPSQHRIASGREGGNVLEGNKSPRYFCRPSVSCLEGACTSSWNLPAGKHQPVVPTVLLSPLHWRRTENTEKRSARTCGSQLGAFLTCGSSPWPGRFKDAVFKNKVFQGREAMPLLPCRALVKEQVILCTGLLHSTSRLLLQLQQRVGMKCLRGALWQAVLSALHFLRELALACLTGSHPLLTCVICSEKKWVIKQIDLGSTEPCFDFYCSCLKVVSQLLYLKQKKYCIFKYSAIILWSFYPRWSVPEITVQPAVIPLIVGQNQGWCFILFAAMADLVPVRIGENSKRVFYIPALLFLGHTVCAISVGVE